MGLVLFCVLTEKRAGHSSETVRHFKTPSPSIHLLRFSPVTLELGACDTGGRLTLWDLSKEAPYQELGEVQAKIKCVAFSPDREHLAWGDWGGSIMLWNLRTKTRSALLNHGNARVSVLEFSPDGKTLAAGDASGTIGFWDVEGSREREVLETPCRLITALDFSSDSRWMTAAGLDESGVTLITTELPSRAIRQRLRLPPKSVVQALEFLPGDDQVLWFDRGQQRLGSWDLNQGNSVLLMDERHRLTSVALTPDGSTLALGTSEGEVHLRNRETLQVTHRLRKQPNPIQCLDFSHDGRFVAVSGAVAGLLVWEP